jgi:hypothetical protein
MRYGQNGILGRLLVSVFVLICFVHVESLEFPELSFECTSRKLKLFEVSPLAPKCRFALCFFDFET